MRPSAACKQSTALTAGVLCLLIGALGVYYWEDITEAIFQSELVLSPSSAAFDMWRETPLPLYLEIFFFNWTNPDAVQAGLAKPHVQQLGPYTYREKHTKVDISWHQENDTITFRQIREWQFDASKSAGTESDRVVALNVLAATIADGMKNYNLLFKRIVGVLLDIKEPLSINKNVREFLFDGFDDRVLDVAIKLRDLGVLNITIPFDRFGWFYDRNMSASYDGVYNMYTGQQNINIMGNVHSWNYATRTPFFRGSCSEVKGSTGELLHPVADTDSTFTVFSNDLCGVLSLKRSREAYFKHEIEGFRFRADASEFDNGTQFPEFKCFTYDGKEMPSGVRDMSECRFGTPAYVSFPHFLGADSWYTSSVDGLHPNPVEHEFIISIEPKTGLPLDLRAQLQINILLQPVKGLRMVEKVPRVVMPMFFFRQSAELTEDLSSQVKILLNLSQIGVYTFSGLALAGCLVLGIAILVTVYGRWGQN